MKKSKRIEELEFALALITGNIFNYIVEKGIKPEDRYNWMLIESMRLSRETHNRVYSYTESIDEFLKDNPDKSQVRGESCETDT